MRLISRFQTTTLPGPPSLKPQATSPKPHAPRPKTHASNLKREGTNSDCRVVRAPQPRAVAPPEPQCENPKTPSGHVQYSRQYESTCAYTSIHQSTHPALGTLYVPVKSPRSSYRPSHTCHPNATANLNRHSSFQMLPPPPRVGRIGTEFLPTIYPCSSRSLAGCPAMLLSACLDELSNGCESSYQRANQQV